jgi:hypothetical protein
MRFLSLSLLLLPLALRAADEPRPELSLVSESAEIEIDLGGGSISSFQLEPDGLNPLQWDSLRPDADASAPRSMGHFLCLDRWGPATKAELSHGMSFHGEAPRVWWHVDRASESSNGWVQAEMSAVLPMAGLAVKRSIRLSDKQAVIVVSEAVSNTRHLGRIYNIVQHPTIGPPFLDETTLVDSKGTRGFMQERPMPNPENPEVAWPKALNLKGEEVDLRQLSDDHSPGVVSYVVEDEYGWITAASPSSGLLIGYIWDSEEYPWINMWRNVRDGKPHARGLEFGTTGLHQPGPALVEKGKIFDEQLFRFIDADETQRFSYACFLVEIPNVWVGTKNVHYDGDSLTVQEMGGGGKRIRLRTGPLFV